MNQDKMFQSFLQAGKSLVFSLPIIIGIIMLLGLLQSYVSPEQIASVFTGQTFRDTFMGALAGSISAGQVLTSYIIGGELLDTGVSLLAVTAFLLAWVTVGIIQFPAEVSFLGFRFALIRNLSSFILAMLVSAAVTFTLGIIS